MPEESREIEPVHHFRFEGVAEVRVVVVEGEPWWVAKDVCRVLGIANHHHAVQGNPGRDDPGLDEDERGLCSVTTPSANQKMLCVNESGLYSLIFKSRKREAKRFKKWITSEVIPTIRKTGSYGQPAIAHEPTALDFGFQLRRFT
jgi:prophage antirepressor-like protein